ncbi:MAG: zinc transporter ZntB, partial [Enterobacteriaceae bacterium]
MAFIEGQHLLVADAVHALQLDGQGSAPPLSAQSKVTADQPAWLHLDYQLPESASWLKTSPLIPDLVRDTLTGECRRPRVSRVGEGILLTLRNINLAKECRPDELITISVYITDSLIVSTQQKFAWGLEDTLQALQKGGGPDNSDDWLVMVCDTLTDHLTDFVEDLHDRIIELEDNLLDEQVPQRGELALLRKQLIVMRRYLSPQRDLLIRLSSDHYSWIEADKQHSIREFADRLARAVDDLDAC